MPGEMQVIDFYGQQSEMEDPGIEEHDRSVAELTQAAQ
jgi:hypothetical protein